MANQSTTFYTGQYQSIAEKKKEEEKVSEGEYYTGGLPITLTSGGTGFVMPSGEIKESYTISGAPSTSWKPETTLSGTKPDTTTPDTTTPERWTPPVDTESQKQRQEQETQLGEITQQAKDVEKAPSTAMYQLEQASAFGEKGKFVAGGTYAYTRDQMRRILAKEKNITFSNINLLSQYQTEKAVYDKEVYDWNKQLGFSISPEDYNKMSPESLEYFTPEKVSIKTGGEGYIIPQKEVKEEEVDIGWAKKFKLYEEPTVIQTGWHNLFPEGKARGAAAAIETATKYELATLGIPVALGLTPFVNEPTYPTRAISTTQTYAPEFAAFEVGKQKEGKTLLAWQPELEGTKGYMFETVDFLGTPVKVKSSAGLIWSVAGGMTMGVYAVAEDIIANKIMQQLLGVKVTKAAGTADELFDIGKTKEIVGVKKGEYLIEVEGVFKDKYYKIVPETAYHLEPTIEPNAFSVEAVTTAKTYQRVKDIWEPISEGIYASAGTATKTGASYYDLVSGEYKGQTAPFPRTESDAKLFVTDVDKYLKKYAVDVSGKTQQLESYGGYSFDITKTQTQFRTDKLSGVSDDVVRTLRTDLNIDIESSGLVAAKGKKFAKSSILGIEASNLDYKDVFESGVGMTKKTGIKGLTYAESISNIENLPSFPSYETEQTSLGISGSYSYELDDETYKFFGVSKSKQKSMVGGVSYIPKDTDELFYRGYNIKEGTLEQFGLDDKYATQPYLTEFGGKSLEKNIRFKGIETGVIIDLKKPARSDLSIFDTNIISKTRTKTFVGAATQIDVDNALSTALKTIQPKTLGLGVETGAVSMEISNIAGKTSKAFSGATITGIAGAKITKNIMDINEGLQPEGLDLRSGFAVGTAIKPTAIKPIAKIKPPAIKPISSLSLKTIPGKFNFTQLKTKQIILPKLDTSVFETPQLKTAPVGTKTPDFSSIGFTPDFGLGGGTPFVPPIDFGFPRGGGGWGGFKYTKAPKVKTKYTPTLGAAFFGITTTKAPSESEVFSGLEERPLFVSKKAKKSKKPQKLSNRMRNAFI